MNKLLILPFLFTMAMLCDNSIATAQMCGVGVFTLEIYTLNGEEKHDINYEVIPINMDSLESIFGLYGNLDRIKNNAYYGSFIGSENVLRIQDTTEKGQRELKKGLNHLRHEKNTKSGNIKNGRIIFHTEEGYFHLFLLKLSSEETEVYIIANLFGGCNRTSVILWNKKLSNINDRETVPHLFIQYR